MASLFFLSGLPHTKFVNRIEPWIGSGFEPPFLSFRIFRNIYSVSPLSPTPYALRIVVFYKGPQKHNGSAFGNLVHHSQGDCGVGPYPLSRSKCTARTDKIRVVRKIEVVWNVFWPLKNLTRKINIYVVCGSRSEIFPIYFNIDNAVKHVVGFIVVNNNSSLLNADICSKLPVCRASGMCERIITFRHSGFGGSGASLGRLDCPFAFGQSFAQNVGRITKNPQLESSNGYESGGKFDKIPVVFSLLISLTLIGCGLFGSIWGWARFHEKGRLSGIVLLLISWTMGAAGFGLCLTI
jgi:hypothetical protein